MRRKGSEGNIQKEATKEPVRKDKTIKEIALGTKNQTKGPRERVGQLTSD